LKTLKTNKKPNTSVYHKGSGFVDVPD